MSRLKSGSNPELPEQFSVPADHRILFFARDRKNFFWLSHFFPSPIAVDGEVWPSVEHYFQSQKSLDPEFRAAIRACIHPGMAKRLGAAPQGPRRRSAQSWFRAHNATHRDDWRDIRLSIMRRADGAKFTQHPELRRLLLATGDAEIIEDTTRDAFWGTGAAGDGENWAGRILMEVRAAFRQNETISASYSADVESF